VQTLL